jgi:heptosyltransferase-3
MSESSGSRLLAIKILRSVCLRKARSFNGRLNSLAILVHGRYGDFILLTKLITQLKTAYPELAISLVTFRKEAYYFFQNDHNISSIFLVKKNITGVFALLTKHRFDVLFNPKDSLSVDYVLLSLLIRARFKVAHAHDYHERFYDELIHLDKYLHSTVRNKGLLQVLGIEKPGLDEIRPYVPYHEVREKVKAFSDVIAGMGCIGINLSASSTDRCWMTGKWRELMNRFPEETFVVFSAPSDRKWKEELEKVIPNVLSSPGTENLGEVAAIVRNLRILVSPDTSLVHLAACYGMPVVAMFHNDPHNQARFAPLSAGSLSIVAVGDKVQSIEINTMVDALQTVIGKQS